jgi:hypothetical protein
MLMSRSWTIPCLALALFVARAALADDEPPAVDGPVPTEGTDSRENDGPRGEDEGGTTRGEDDGGTGRGEVDGGTRGEDDGGRRDRRGGSSSNRLDRRPIEGGDSASKEDKNQTKLINLLAPPRCGVERAPRFRNALLAMQNPTEGFYIEAWGNARIYFVQDPIYYFFRASEDVYVTLFWIGPEGSVFIPFTNLKISGNQNHKIDPSNIIVEPVGLERWRIIATPKPHALPCEASGDAFLAALRKIQGGGKWAAARWDVTSKSYRRRRGNFED